MGSGQKPTGTGEIYSGNIKSMSEWYNNGFISCDDLQGKYAKDVFFLTHLAPGKRPGDPVVFELGFNHRGEPQALKLHCGAGLAQGMTKEEIMETPPLREYGVKDDMDGSLSAGAAPPAIEDGSTAEEP